MASQIKFYPVDNGDKSLITIKEGAYTTNILVDSKIRKSSEGDDDPSKYDVKADLMKVLEQRTVNSIEGVSYVDVFILTHGDKDHLHGFEDNFYRGDPKSYGKTHKENK